MASSSDGGTIAWRTVGRLEHHAVDLACLQGQRCADVVAVALQAGRSMQGELQRWCPEHRAVLGELEVVGLLGRSRTGERTRGRSASRRARTAPPGRAGGGRVARSGSSTGMKSITSPTPPAVMNRVIRIAVSGKYSCLTTQSSPSAAIRKRPPLSWSSSDANTLGAVEAWATEPVDRAVGAHQRGGLQVTDQTVLGDRRVTVHRRTSSARSCMSHRCQTVTSPFGSVKVTPHPLAACVVRLLAEGTMVCASVSA